MPFTPRTVTRRLPCDLTDEEVLTKTNQLVENIREARALDEQRKEEMKSFRDRLKSHAAKIDSLSRQIEARVEHRDVECVEEKQDGKNLIALIRKDTGKVWSTRPMTDEERQERLPIDPVAADPSKPLKVPLSLVPIEEGRKKGGKKKKTAAGAAEPQEPTE